MSKYACGGMAVRGLGLGFVLLLAACGGGSGGDGSPDPAPPKAQFSLPGATESTGSLPAPSSPDAKNPPSGSPLTVAAPGDTVSLDFEIDLPAEPAFAYVQPAGSNQLFKIDLRSTAKAARSLSIQVVIPADATAEKLCFGVAVEDVEGNVSAPKSLCLALPDNAPAGRPFVAAGDDFAVNGGETATLSSSVELRDGSISSYRWTQLSGTSVNLTGGNQAEASFVAPSVSAPEILRFAIEVTSTTNLSDRDEIEVTLNPPLPENVLPQASAGEDQAVDEGVAVALAGTASDSDGEIASTAWTQTEGPSAELTGADTLTPSFTAPEVPADSKLRFVLTVTDDRGGSASDAVEVLVRHVNKLPVVRAGDDQDVAERGEAVLSGSAEDLDGQIVSYAWRQDSGPEVVLQGADQAEARFNVPEVTADSPATFTLTVTDDAGAQSSDSTTLTFLHINRTPTVDAGVNQFVLEDDAVALNGVASDPDGPLASVAWSQIDGPAVDIANADQLLASFTAPAVDVDTDLRLRLTVTDAEGLSASDEIVIHVLDRDSIARACGDGAYCAGSAKRKITPSDAHIVGVNEERLGQDITQRFHLGGFGFGPFEPAKAAEALFGLDPRLCEPTGFDGQCLSNPPAERAFHCPDFGGDCEAEEQEHTWVRVFYLAEPDQAGGFEEQLLFVTLDAVGSGNIIQRDMAAAISQATGVPTTHILIGATHSHAGADLQGLWGGVPQDWIAETLYKEAADAASEAVANALDAELTWAGGIDGAWNRYRRPQIRDGANVDEQIAVLQAKNSLGEVLGTLVQFAAHPVSIGADSGGANGRVPHADYALGIEDAVESATGATAIYYNGAIADASPSGPTEGGDDYQKVRSRGQCIAASALALLSVGQPCVASELDPAGIRRIDLEGGLALRQAEAQLPITNPLFLAVGATGTFNRYYDFSPVPVSQIPFLGDQADNLPQVVMTASTAVSRVTLGDAVSGVEIVTLPGEATNSFGQQIRALAQSPNMMFLGLTQNSFGYILPEEEYNLLNPTGDAGFVLPFTGYEEFVSLGPLTAPLLRLQAYGPLFDVGQDDPRNVPAINACFNDPRDPQCVVTQVLANIDYIQDAYASQCRRTFGVRDITGEGEDTPLAPISEPVDDAIGEVAQQLDPVCELLDPNTPLRPLCDELGLGEDVCAAFGERDAATAESRLEVQAADAALRGCDLLDASNCLYPFPSDHFVEAAPAGSVQAQDGWTGKRLKLKLQAMPRNAFGKPIDPTEWNRNDGFSPGQMIVTYVPNLAANDDGTVQGAPRITHLSESLDVTNSSVLVLDAETGQPHPVWAEIDLNAGLLLPGSCVADPDPTTPTRPALLIRPATNFAEGRRYVVVLKNLVDAGGGPIRAQTTFRTCRDGLESDLSAVAARCEALTNDVFPVLNAAGIEVTSNEGLYLAWDFTVASAENNIARLRHMRDDAFAKLGQRENASGQIKALGRAPEFSVDKITSNPRDGIAKRIEGTITVPSYVLPIDPAPGDEPGVFYDRQDRSGIDAVIGQLCSGFGQIDEQFEDGCDGIFDLFFDTPGIADGASLPPNRLAYKPNDAANQNDPQGQVFGDGLPDSVGTMTTRFTCQVPEQADGQRPARPGIYGHGLLDGHQAVTYDHVPQFSTDHNLLFCGVDLFGFATGDVPNVFSVLVDLSNFPVIPDASQQGLLNFMFLARALRHPDGFGSHPEFQDAEGRPLFDNREVFYDGNSQGGITGGPIVAMSKDITRGVFGVVGMNYSTLLRRSVDFDNEFEAGDLPPYALPLYLSYRDDLDRNLGFALMQMLWDRSENNGYAHHITNNAALKGPDNQVLLHPAFADHQVTHWSAQVMARTIGVEVGDLYFRKAGEDVPFTFNSKFEFFEQRDPDVEYFWNIPLVDRDAGASYDDANCTVNCRSTKSALIEFDEGETATPPIGNVPPRADHHDPHGYPRAPAHSKCQKSHFLHSQGHIIDTRGERDVRAPAECPPLPVADPASDTDNDGVQDLFDQCPLTPTGSSVGGDGCANFERDSDNDGVTDNLDQCPDTASGDPADASGCAPAQKDSDNDGVRDDLDQCPTQGPAGDGQILDATGCAVTAQALAGAAVVEATWNLGSSAGQFAASGSGIAGERGYDPYQHSTRKLGSDIYGTEISTRALVVEGGNGKRIAIVSNDLYLPNDLLRRRLIQLLAEADEARVAAGGEPLGIHADNLAMTVSHSHTSPFYSTPAWGTWIFQDVFDLRFYHYMATKMRDAIIAAADDMRPVSMGGTAVYANDVRGHTYGPYTSKAHATTDTPAGQPYDYTSRQMYVLRFDNADDGSNYANWIVLGIHPEWIWGEEVINGDLTQATMRMLDRETGAITVMSQSETGTSGPHKDGRAHDSHERREFEQSAFPNVDRAARLVADNVHGALQRIATDQPWDPNQFAAKASGFVVDYSFRRYAPPATRPVPGVSNCNADRAYYEANPGVPVVGLPDCAYPVGDAVEPFENGYAQFIQNNAPEPLNFSPFEVARGVAGAFADSLALAGVPLPHSYSATTLTGVEEQATVPIQAFKLGDVALTFCPCEQFTDTALNVISRLDKVENNLYNGWDWDLGYEADNPLRNPANNGDFVHGPDEVGCTVPANPQPDSVVTCPNPKREEKGSLTTTYEAYLRMKAQIHNDAAGWEELRPDAPLHAETEPAGFENIDQIKGNFTHEELDDFGYGLVIPVGMANDYWGYMPAYREYRAGDHYRKALSGLGPHGADFLATRMARQAASLNGRDLEPPTELDEVYFAEDQRAEQLAKGLGEAAEIAVAGYMPTLPADGGEVAIKTQPQSIEWFDAATVRWVGGNPYLGLPDVQVERCVLGTVDACQQWQVVGTTEGEVQLHVDFLQAIQVPIPPDNPLTGVPDGSPVSQKDVDDGYDDTLGAASIATPHPLDLALWRAGQFEWVWTASFEAFISDVAIPEAADQVRPNAAYVTPPGHYRFVINGQRKGAGDSVMAFAQPLLSSPFEVRPWSGLEIIESDDRGSIVALEVGPRSTNTAFQEHRDSNDELRTDLGTEIVGPVDYPDTWASVLAGGEAAVPWPRNERNMFRYDKADPSDDQVYCFRCSFGPWLDAGDVRSVRFEVEAADGSVLGSGNAVVNGDGRFSVNALAYSSTADIFVPAGGMADEYGSTNAACFDLRGSGCDRDEDGVQRHLDLCPNTTAGARVDADGCTVPEPENPAARHEGALGAVGRLSTGLNDVTTALLSGDPQAAGAAFGDALAQFGEDLAGLPGMSPEEAIGLDRPADEAAMRAVGAARDVEPVVLTGAHLLAWSQPAAMGIAQPHFSGFENFSGATEPGHGPRNPHAGLMLYPAGWQPGDAPQNPLDSVEPSHIAAFGYRDGQWEEIRVQVDERYPWFLANGNSTFSFYSGIDAELTYAWDTESWGKTKGQCETAYDANGIDVNRPGLGVDGVIPPLLYAPLVPGADPDQGVSAPIPDPIAGLDHDDEIVFMASDAGDLFDGTEFPADWQRVQAVALADPLDASSQRVVYLVERPSGSSFSAQNGYVRYERKPDANQWIDRGTFASDDPEKLGSSNTNYGANLSGTVCREDGSVDESNDRFPRDGVVVTTDTYRWEASGRWMIRDIRVRDPENPSADWSERPDLIDRWKGRAFQQSPDSAVSLVGFEDEQVNWEGNASLLGERQGPVRAIREVWGADSGTNVTKVETFYRDVVSYRYRVRVHPIPSDGLYTSWDYNRSAMVSDDPAVAGGRYFTVLRPQGVPIDGRNDELGNVDGLFEAPAFFDAADPSFNLPLGFFNWEQVSGKGNSGSLVYLFEMTGATSLTNPLVVPYYRDDACLDDGTGDDPVARPFPGDASTDAKVRNGYVAAAGAPDYDSLTCEQRQGAYASHGVHYFFTHDSDNLFSPVTSTEIDGTQWQFMVPTATPTNVAEPYANVIKAKLQPIVIPMPVAGGGDPAPSELLCTADNSEVANYSHYIGSLHQHSGFSDGRYDKTPADYYQAGADLQLDFMGGSEHSDNALIPVTADQGHCLAAVDAWRAALGEWEEELQAAFEERRPPNPPSGVPDPVLFANVADCFQPSEAHLRKWAATQEFADQKSSSIYTAFRGFEWTSDRFNHINVFFSEHDLNAKTSTGYALLMQDFWTWLRTDPAQRGGADGVAVFNHPGREDKIHAACKNLDFFEPFEQGCEQVHPGDPAYNWNDFGTSATGDLAVDSSVVRRMVGIELYGKSSDYYDNEAEQDNFVPEGGWYAYALDRGWHLGPIGAEDEHGTQWAQPTRAKTVMIAKDRSRASLKEAMLARRFYALAHNYGGVRLSFDVQPAGESASLPMGSRLGRAAGTRVDFRVRVENLLNPRIEIIGPGGAVLYSGQGSVFSFSEVLSSPQERWRYVRVYDGNKAVAVSAPIWTHAGDDNPICDADPYPPAEPPVGNDPGEPPVPAPEDPKAALVAACYDQAGPFGGNGEAFCAALAAGLDGELPFSRSDCMDYGEQYDPSGNYSQFCDAFFPASDGRVYQVYLTSGGGAVSTDLEGGFADFSDSYGRAVNTIGELIATTVHAPDPLVCSSQCPLILQGHGYGSSREQSPGYGFPGQGPNYGGYFYDGQGGAVFSPGMINELVAAGYGVISIDQRGFGESGGTVRLLDPEFEGEHLLQILDWAQTALPWVSTKVDDTTGDTVLDKLGAIGGSYGGGYQMLIHNIDPLKRLDAIVPEITWHDLSYSLSPGGVIKSGWINALIALGAVGSQNQVDDYVTATVPQGLINNELPEEFTNLLRYHGMGYFCSSTETLGDNGRAPQTTMLSSGAGADGTQAPFYAPWADGEKRGIDALFMQGFRDVLFNFNEAYYNAQCLRSIPGDHEVRLFSYQFGHVLPGPGVAASFDFNPSPDFEADRALDTRCGEVGASTAILAWFDEKLKDGDDFDSATPLGGKDCLSLASGDAVLVDTVPRGGLRSVIPPTTVQAGAQVPPAVVELLTVAEGGDVLAGIPTAQLSVDDPVATNQDIASDAIIYVGIGHQRAVAPGVWDLVDDQLRPLRGAVEFNIDLVGVAERPQAGDKLALLLYGWHP